MVTKSVCPRPSFKGYFRGQWSEWVIFWSVIWIPFSALTLLVGQQERYVTFKSSRWGWRHYVMGLSIRLCVCSCKRVQVVAFSSLLAIIVIVCCRIIFLHTIVCNVIRSFASNTLLTAILSILLKCCATCNLMMTASTWESQWSLNNHSNFFLKVAHVT